MLWKLSTQKLAKIASYGGIFTLGSCIYMHVKIHEKAVKSPFYQEAVAILEAHNKAKETVGPPITYIELFDAEKLDLGDKHNCVTETDCRIKIPLAGVKEEGNLLVWADRKPDTNWVMGRVDLELTTSDDLYTIYYREGFEVPAEAS